MGVRPVNSVLQGSAPRSLSAVSLRRRRKEYIRVILSTCFVSDKLSSREFGIVNEGVLRSKRLYCGQYGDRATARLPGKAKDTIGLLPVYYPPGRNTGFVTVCWGLTRDLWVGLEQSAQFADEEIGDHAG